MLSKITVYSLGLICILIALFGAYYLLRYLYGRDHRRWKPLLFSKNVKFKSILSPKIRDGISFNGNTGERDRDLVDQDPEKN